MNHWHLATTCLLLIFAGCGSTTTDGLAYDDVDAKLPPDAAGQASDASVDPSSDRYVADVSLDSTSEPEASIPVRGIPDTLDPDPSYVIEYSQTKFVPPDGKVLLIVGQEKHDIPHYVDAVGVVPGALASYWGASSNEAITTDSTDRGVGIQNIDELVRKYPGTAMQSALWLVGTYGVCDDTVAGKYDANIDAFASWAKRTSVPIYLRIGYEFDNPGNELDPACYKAAFKRIVDRMGQAGVSNVAYVWHSYASTPYQNRDVMEWYPGDDYVHWFAVSVFGHFYQSTSWPPPTHVVQRLNDFVDLARTHKKPVMVAESAPAGGIVKDSYRTWDTWFVTMFEFLYSKNVKAFSYICADWDSYPGFANLHWGDTRVEAHPLVREQWLRETAKSRYLKRTDDLFALLGYSED